MIDPAKVFSVGGSLGGIMGNTVMAYDPSCLVNNPGTEMVVREMGISVLAPSVKAPWHLTPVPGPLTSGPMPPLTHQPPSADNGTHSGVNRNGAVFRQVARFLFDNEAAVACRSGDTVVACDCDPDGGGVCD